MPQSQPSRDNKKKKERWCTNNDQKKPHHIWNHRHTNKEELQQKDHLGMVSRKTSLCGGDGCVCVGGGGGKTALSLAKISGNIPRVFSPLSRWVVWYTATSIHYNLFTTRVIVTHNTVLDITWFKDGSQLCIDYIEKWPWMVIFQYNLYIFVWI